MTPEFQTMPVGCYLLPPPDSVNKTSYTARGLSIQQSLYVKANPYAGAGSRAWTRSLAWHLRAVHKCHCQATNPGPLSFSFLISRPSYVLQPIEMTIVISPPAA